MNTAGLLWFCGYGWLNNSDISDWSPNGYVLLTYDCSWFLDWCNLTWMRLFYFNMYSI